MKFILISIFFCCLIAPVFGQQTPNNDNELLLDYYQNQRFADAVDYLKRTHPEPVTDRNILARLAYASQMAGRLPDAETYYQRIYLVDSTNTAVLFNLGAINLRRSIRTLRVPSFCSR